MLFWFIDLSYLIPLGCSCTKSGGLSSKSRFILYRGFPLWLGSTGEGCDSIQVSGCQTRAWRSTFYTRASLVHMVLGVLILYIDFHFMLDSRQGLGFNLCTMLKYTLKSSPCSYFSTVRLGGPDFTQMYAYIYIEYYRIIYNILIYVILIFWIFLESYGFLWNLLDFYSKKIIEKRI